jgi:hypothetical protein
MFFYYVIQNDLVYLLLNNLVYLYRFIMFIYYVYLYRFIMFILFVYFVLNNFPHSYTYNIYSYSYIHILSKFFLHSHILSKMFSHSFVILFFIFNTQINENNFLNFLAFFHHIFYIFFHIFSMPFSIISFCYFFFTDNVSILKTIL